MCILFNVPGCAEKLVSAAQHVRTHVERHWMLDQTHEVCTHTRAGTQIVLVYTMIVLHQNQTKNNNVKN